MSEYMEAPPPPARQGGGTEAMFERASFLSQDNNNLEQLFRLEADSQGSRQTALASQVSQRRSSSPAPSLQRRRGEQKASGFWGLVQGQPGRRTEPESVASMQEELEALLLMERRQEQLLKGQNEIGGRQKVGGLAWSRLGQGSKVSPLVTSLGASGMKKVQPRGSAPSPVKAKTGVVDIVVPKDQNTGFFGVGSSLSFSPTRAQDNLALGSQQLQSRNSNGQQQQRISSVVNSVPSMNSDQVLPLDLFLS